MVTNRFLFLIYGLASTFAFVERNLVSLRPTDIYSTTPDISKFSGGTRIHSSRRDKQRQENWKPYNNTISINNACNMIQRLGSNKKIDAWMDLLANEGKFSNPPIFAFWSVQEQITFIKLLKQYRAYKSISIFLDNLGKQNVKVCTTAIFSLALSPNCRDQAIDILDRMDEAGTEPTALTFIALLGSVDGPSATVEMMKRIESYKNVKVNVEVFNSAIYACCRTHLGSRPDDNDWKTALDLLQQMRRKRINPTTKTYHAILQVLSRTGKVKMAFSLLEQLNNTKNLQPDDRVWMAALRVCAQAGDCGAAIQVVNEMQEAGCRPNLRHCSALLKTFSQAGQDQLAYAALGMMLGEDIQTTSKTSAFSLPLTAPDLVALNTVIAACSKGGNFEGAKSIFERMKTGEFSDPISHQVISPDRITYHSILVGCRDSETATSIVKEMRLSRRNRYGVIPPTNATYAHAISACQKARYPDLKGVELLLRWAEDDGIKPNVFMYSGAIWTAQRSGNCAKALEFFSEMQSAECRVNSVAFNGVISALCDHGDIQKAVAMYDHMKDQGFHLFASTCRRVAAALQSMKNMDNKAFYLERIVARMSSEERTSRIGGAVFEALISVYGSQGRFDEASKTFETIEGGVDGPCLRAILLACSKASPVRWLDATTILHTSDIVEGATAGPGQVDQIALSNAIIACAKANEFEEGLNLLQLYGLLEYQRPRASHSISVVAMNALIASCGRGRRPDLALALFNEMQSEYGISPDGRSYRSTVIACNQAEHQFRGRRSSSHVDESVFGTDDDSLVVQWWECALALLRRMREEHLIPDVQTYSSVISACEAAGEWQRALGILQMILDDEEEHSDSSSLNLYCFNAAISACEKGGAWVEALELYERMLDKGGSIKPNFVTLSSLVEAFDKADQKELAISKYYEGRKLNIVKPWRWTRNQSDVAIAALDLHNFSAAMAKAAVRSTMESYLRKKRNSESLKADLVIITGKGKHSANNPILQSTTLKILQKEFGVDGRVDDSNEGRIIVDLEVLRSFVSSKSW